MLLSQHRRSVWEDAHPLGPPAELPVEPLLRIGRPELAPVGFRKPGKGQQVGRDLGQEGGGREAGRELVNDPRVLGPNRRGGLGKERAEVATRSWAALGTRVNRFRAKWVRQRCQLAPAKTAAMASLRPGWASLIATWTPERPRATKLRRKAVQPAPSSLGTTSTIRPLSTALGQRSQPDAGSGAAGERPVPEGRVGQS